MGSTRLPGKVMKKINGKTVIELLIARLTKSNQLNKIIIATSDKTQNDPLVKHINSLGYICERGSEDDVLARYYETAVKHKLEVIVRITGDCPLVDPLIVDDIIEMYKCGDSQYISNVSPPSYPDGLDVEVFSFEALKLAYNQATDPFEREHVTPFIRNQSNIKQSNLINDVDLSNLRWTLDEKEDFEVIKNIFNHFHPNIFFHWSKILELHEMKPEFFSANKRFIRNEA